MLLAFTMVLTFMPMLAFAEGEEADAEPQATELTAEEVEAEAVEEVAQKEAAEAVAEEDVTVTSLKFIPADGFEFNATEGEEWLDYSYPGNTFVAGYSDGTTKKFIDVEYEDVDEDGEPCTCYDFFLNGDKSKEKVWFGYQINGSEDGKFVAGNNTVKFSLDGVYTDPVTVKAAPKVTAVAFTPASGFVFEAMEGADWVDYYGIGNKFTISYSDNSTKEYICKQYDRIDEEDGDTYKAVDFFENGDITKKPFYDIDHEIVTPADGIIKVGDGNRVKFRCGDAYSKEFTVKGTMAPIDVEFVPASGVTLWGFESSYHIDELYTEGNKFIVTYSDKKTKKTFVCLDVPHEENGEKYSSTGYYENGKVTKDIYGNDNEVYFERDIPEGGLKRGNNAVRFGIDSSADTVWSSKTYNVIGKPYAVNVTVTPSTFNGIIYSTGEYDIDWYKAGNQVVVKYNDGTTKTFKPGEVKHPEGFTYPAFKCGDEVLMMGWPELKLKEGKNTVPLTFWGIADDEIVREVTVNASKPSACTKHSLHKIKAVKATCQEPGIKAHYECSVCHKIFSDKKGKKETTLAKLATKKAKHVFKKKNVSDEYLKSPATCTKKATYYYACKTCGEKGKKTFTAGKALGHDFVAGSITKATGKKDGKIASKCSRCGKTNKGVKIPKASKVFTLNKKSIKYVGEGKEKDAISLKIKAGKYPVSSEEYDVVYSEPVYKGKKSKGTVTVTFKPDCKYYTGSLTLTYKITKVPKK